MTEAEKIQMEIKQKEAEVLGLKKKLEQQKKEDEQYTRWKPNNGERYYVVTSVGVFDYIWMNKYSDLKYYKAYNTFKTKEDAENARETFKDLLKLYQAGLLTASNSPVEIKMSLVTHNLTEWLKSSEIDWDKF